MNLQVEESSFRDPDGFVFFENDRVYRAIQPSYFETWDRLLSSGFLEELISAGKIVAFKEEGFSPSLQGKRILEVEKIPFISYPSEWTFTQSKKAALLTLELQLKALEKGYSLKDASAFNVQFKGNKAVFIDLFSFERYQEGTPWNAYRQFCMHFLCPLLLYKYNVPAVRKLMGANLDGIPLDACSRLLPFSSRLNLLAYTHIHLHASMEKKHEESESGTVTKLRLPKKKLVAMLTHMRDSIRQIKPGTTKTNWTSYYADFSYSPEGFEFKKHFVTSALRTIQPTMCLDLGCNTGEFSEIASGIASHTIACDSDEQVVARLQEKKLQNTLALCVDLADPTPARGWDHSERKSFLSRAAEADFVLALALVHHLSIAGNVPFSNLAKLFSRFKDHLVIEFVPKNDPQVKRLLVSRRDIFVDYTEQNFEQAFSIYFTIEKKETVPGSSRILFLMKRKNG